MIRDALLFMDGKLTAVVKSQREHLVFIIVVCRVYLKINKMESLLAKEIIFLVEYFSFFPFLIKKFMI